jgi:hypothetical protein
VLLDDLFEISKSLDFVQEKCVDTREFLKLDTNGLLVAAKSEGVKGRFCTGHCGGHFLGFLFLFVCRV